MTLSNNGLSALSSEDKYNMKNVILLMYKINHCTLGEKKYKANKH